MKSNFQAILKSKHFFDTISSSNNSIQYTFKEPSQILMKNIHISWLKYLHVKTHKSMLIFNQKPHTDAKPPFGVMYNSNFDYKNSIIKNNLNEYAPQKKSSLNFNIILPKEDQMQYFIQWLRYRKYWWSSITTTPSLFAIDDIKQGDSEADVDIVARLPSGSHPVEHIQMKVNHDKYENCCCLSCSMSLEDALLILLLDGSNNLEGDYLRLHRKITPYKISFALHFQEASNKVTLMELSTLLYNRLKLEKITAWLPDFSMDILSQVKENLHMGVTYTAILSEGTLETGIFYLLNSSTMLKEQIHVADFHAYAASIFNAK